MKRTGLLLLDKPEGPTAHDMVALVRRATGLARVGHSGTLDPFASGLMVLCLGWATRLAEYLSALPKCYRGVVRLGERTDTDDCTGTVVARSDGWRDLDEERVRAALGAQLGRIEQRPPAYCAKKIAGRRAYSLARRGETPRLRSQPVTVSRLDLCEFAPPDLSIEVECSSGTYVRAIARDLGEALGVGAHLAVLRRLRVGRFSVDDAVSVERATSGRELLDRLLPPEAAVAHLPQAWLDSRVGEALRHGRAVEWREGDDAPDVAVRVEERLVAIAELKGGRLRPKKVFAD